MTGFRLPREHGGWTMWGAAVAAGATHAAGHGVPAAATGGLAAGLLLLYAAGDWAQSAAASALGLPFRGRSDADALAGPLLVGAGLLLAAGTGPAGWTWPALLAAALAPGVLAAALRAALPPFDRRLLAVSSFALAAPALLFGTLAVPGCPRCAAAFWAGPATGFPALALLIATRLPAPPATVKRLGWFAATVTLVLAAAWVGWFRAG